jgi:hypothetical protein
MESGDKGALFFFTAVTILCAAALFLPVVQEGRATRGISGALGLPAWILVSGTMVICAVISVTVIVKNARRNR